MGIRLVNRENNTRVNEQTNPALSYPLMKAKLNGWGVVGRMEAKSFAK